MFSGSKNSVSGSSKDGYLFYLRLSQILNKARLSCFVTLKKKKKKERKEMITQNVTLSNAYKVNTKRGTKFKPGLALIGLSNRTRL